MGRKQLKCPLCGARLIDAVSSVKTELVAEENMRTGWRPDYFQKCACCKKQIAIRKVS